MTGAWWGCHWCSWEAPIRFRPFDRWRATREFRAHLTHEHPDITYDNPALWGTKMNPFNVAWIVLTWILAACAFSGYFLGDHRIALAVVLFMTVLITGQTIGADRAERLYEAEKDPALTRGPGESPNHTGAP